MLTRKKDLRTGRSVWMQYPTPAVPSTPLAKDMQTDVAIIGAGISGAMVAEELTRAGMRVVLLDRRGPLLGATTATTALLQYEVDEPLISLQKKIGVEKANRAWRRSKLGLESLSAKLQSLQISCDMVRRPSLYLAGNQLDATELQEECEARNLIGLPTDYLTRDALRSSYGLKRDGALRSFNSISLHPRRMAAGFLRAACEQGAAIHAPTNVTHVEPHKNGVTLVTESGPTIRAGAAVFATGYEIPEALQTRKHRVHSTWAIATKPQPRNLWPEECFIWEASDPYLYMRTTSDGRVICGGEDEEFCDEETRNARLPEKMATLERKLKALLPQLDTEAQFAWTGSFGGSTNGLPSIGRMPGMAQCYAIMAFGGNGITYSRIAAELVAAVIQGKKDPDADLFAFT